jgi:hypothetical protein
MLICTLVTNRYVERFDPKERLWLPLAPLPTVRFGLACSTLHGYGYLVGGTSSLVALYSHARTPTCISTRVFELVCALSDELADSHACHALRFNITGSSASGGSLSTVERYDMGTNRWEQVASCSTTRAGLATAVLDDQLYAAGGASDQLFGSVRLLQASASHAHRRTLNNHRDSHCY